MPWSNPIMDSANLGRTQSADEGSKESRDQRSYSTDWLSESIVRCVNAATDGSICFNEKENGNGCMSQVAH